MAYLETLVTYGSRYLDPSEYAVRLQQVYVEHCRGLGRAVLNVKGKAFWDYQRRELAKLGLRIDYGQVLRGAFASLRANAQPLLAATKVKLALRHILSR